MDLGVESHSISNRADDCGHYKLRFLSYALKFILADADSYVLNSIFVGKEGNAKRIVCFGFVGGDDFLKFGTRIETSIDSYCGSKHLWIYRNICRGGMTDIS